MKKILLFLSIIITVHHLRAQSSDIDALILAWKQDSLGCLGLRTFNMAERIFQEKKINNLYHQDAIFMILGKPNMVKESLNGEMSFIYHIHYTCRENIPIHLAEFDYCFVEIRLRKNTAKPTSISQICN